MFSKVLGFFGVGNKNKNQEIKRKPPAVPNYKVAIIGGNPDLRSFIRSLVLQKPGDDDLDEKTQGNPSLYSFEKRRDR